MQGSYISFYSNDVTLEIWLEDLEGVIKNRWPLFGSIQVRGPYLKDKEIYWDNLDFFLDISKSVFKDACKKDIDMLDMNWKDVYQDVKAVFNAAKLCGLLAESKVDKNKIISDYLKNSNDIENTPKGDWTSTSTGDYIGAPSTELVIADSFVTLSQLSLLIDQRAREIIRQEIGIITPPF
jgi:hypothetical protein